MNLTDDEIVKSLEICIGKRPLEDCPECPNYISESHCKVRLSEVALDLINRQKAEIERLRLENEELLYPRYGIELNTERLHREWADIRERAFIEFSERVYGFLTKRENWNEFKDQWLVNGECDWLKHKLDNLAKERLR